MGEQRTGVAVSARCSSVDPETMVAGVAAHGLGSGRALPDSPLDPATWSVVLQLVIHQRVTGLLGRAVRDGAFAATAYQRGDAAAAEADGAAIALRLERTLLQVTALLDDRRIEHRVLKGPALAHTAYEDPALRSFGDVDLLVRSEDYDSAVATLLAAGASYGTPELAVGFDGRFGKGRSFVLGDGLEVDLHRTLVSGPLASRIAHSDLFLTASPFCLGNRTLSGLGLEEQFVHACLHAALGNVVPRLTSLRDVAELLLGAGLDEFRVRRLSAAWALDSVVARAVCLTWATFGLSDTHPLSQWAAERRITPSEQRLINLYVGAAGGWGPQAVETLRTMPGVGAKMAYLRALAFPERELLTALGRGRLDWWRRGFTLLLGRTGRRR